MSSKKIQREVALKPKALVISSYNSLSLALTQKFSENNLPAIVVGNDSKSFFPLTKIDEFFAQTTEGIDYLICLIFSTDLKKISEDERLLEVGLDLAKKFQAKTLFIFPFVQKKEVSDFYHGWVKKILDDQSTLSGIIYLGEVLDFIDVDSRLGEIIKNLERGKIEIANEGYFYPVSLAQALRFVFSSILSLKAFGKVTAFISAPLTAQKFISILENYGFRVKTEGRVGGWITPRFVDERRYTSEDAVGLLTKVISTKRHNFDISRSEMKTLKKSTEGSGESPLKKHLKIKVKKRFLIPSLALFLLAPLLILFISLGGLYLSKGTLAQGDLETSRRLLNASNFLSNFSRRYALVFLDIPFFKVGYESIYEVSSTIEGISGVGLKTSSVITDTLLIFENINNENPSDLESRLKTLSFGLERLYSDLGFLEGENLKLKSKFVNILKQIHLIDSDFGNLRQKVLQLKLLVQSGDRLLGVKNSASYLILLEDNSVLKGSGGEIVSIALAKMAEGRLTELSVYDVSFADKNLRGKVEPPEPLKTHFAKDNQRLKDSNWYVDFPTSAEKAEWFLDKELDISVDGVISIDKQALKQILSITQSAAELSQSNEASVDYLDSFRSFLEAVFAKNQGTKLISEIHKLLDEKHILLFLHDEGAKDIINDLGWDGSFKGQSCTSCYEDLVGLVEASETGGSENIVREVELTISLEERLIKRKLIYYLENKNEHDYKVYVRLVARSDSGFSPTVHIWSDSREDLKTEVAGFRGYKEGGTLIEIGPDQTKAIVFAWEGGADDLFSKGRQYQLLVKKQPGVGDYPVKITVKPPGSKNYLADFPFSLTEEGALLYNTRMERDFTSRIFWK